MVMLSVSNLLLFYICETWSLTLRKKCKPRVCENGAEEDIWTEEE
jgi:hypothetical protein